MSKIVNSWDEWSPLKRIIVGRVRGTQIPAPEPNWQYPNAEGGFPLGSWGMFPEEMVDKAEEQQENFVKMLEKRGVTVDRVVLHPVTLSPTPVSTPDWTQLNMHGISNPRDMFITMGNEIIECAGSHRSRWYEYLHLRPLFQEYFKQDPDFLWSSAPKPRLTEKSYVRNWDYLAGQVWDTETKNKMITDWQYQLTEEEPLWDGADGARAGRDIFWKCSAVTNRSGLDWLKRHFAARGIRVHPIIFDYRAYGDYKTWHIDCELTMVRPGLVITNPSGPIYNQEIIDLFKRNDWEMVVAAPAVYEYNAPVSLCGTFGHDAGGQHGTSIISMNTLSLDTKAIFVEAHETAYMEQLDNMGIEVIPVPYQHVVPFGGALHCTTLDVYRESAQGDYFPKQ